jgi:hypothetical protein
MRLHVKNDPRQHTRERRAHTCRVVSRSRQFFTERSADSSIILYWQHDGPNSRRKPQPMTADEAMTAAQAATLKELAEAAYELAVCGKTILEGVHEQH